MRRPFSLLLLALLLVMAVPVMGATFDVSTQPPSVSLPVHDDVYAAGGMVSINQGIRGDALVAGGDVAIRESVGQDLAAAGGTVTLTAPVGDDARIAGGDITVRSRIAGDLVIVGGSVTIAPEATIGGDLIVAGGDVRVQGKVLGNTRVHVGSFTLEGFLNGNLIAKGEDIHIRGTVHGFSKLTASDIRLGPNARFGRRVEYWRPQGTMSFGNAAPEALFNPNLRPPVEDRQVAKAAGVFAGFFMLFSLLSGAVVIGLLILVTRKYFTEAATDLTKYPGWSLLTGLGFFVLTPIAVLLLMLTIIGIPLGLFLLFLYIFTLFFGAPLSAIVLAKWVQLQYQKKWKKGMLFLVSLVAFAFLKMLLLVPVVGWLLKCLLVIACIGAILRVKRRKWKLVA